jgi:hypothetical protein
MPELVWLAAPFTVALLVAVAVGPVRRACVHGWHCLLRHDVLWKLPAAFALAYGLFHAGAELFLRWRTRAEWPALVTEPPPDLPALALEELPRAVLPSLEMLVAADLNCLVATFPISVPAGALFLLNWRGTSSELRRALCRRRELRGWALFAALVVCALCALLKPVPMVFLPELARYFPLRDVLLGGTIVNALAFVFEYLLGTAVQVYLTLTAYGWVRGLHFPHQRLMHFAVRRLGFVFKWALVPVVATLAFIHLPLFVEVLRTGTPATLRLEPFAQPVLLSVMLLGVSVPIRLALHNDSLRAAWTANLRFLRRHGPVTAAFLIAALGLLTTLETLEAAGRIWLDGTIAGLAWGVMAPVVGAAVGGWILAAWVCFYTGTDNSTREVIF